MMKTILFATAFMTLAFAGFSTTSAYACGGKPCAKCAQTQKAPCTKCLKAGKTCKCGKKSQKPCEKVLGQKGKKPCAKSLSAQKSPARANPTRIFFNE